MKQLLLHEPGHLQQVEAPFDKSLAPGEALLRVHRVGICGTDLHAFAGNQPFFSYPRVCGHELGLEVMQTGTAVTTLKPGDRCSLEPYFNLQEGQAVRNGKPNCGEQLTVFGVHVDGGMQEFIKVPARYLHPSDRLSYDQLALVEPLAIGYHAVQRAQTRDTDKVLVIGAGPIGLATAQFATITGAQTVVMDIKDDRLDFCRQHLPVKGTIHALKVDPATALSDYFEGDLPTVVFDATGSSASMMKAFEWPAHGGRLVFIGLFQGEVTFHDPLFHKKELTLLASRNALGRDFDEIIALMENGQVDTSWWITHRLPFGQVPEQFAGLTRPEAGVLKAMIEL